MSRTRHKKSIKKEKTDKKPIFLILCIKLKLEHFHYTIQKREI